MERNEVVGRDDGFNFPPELINKVMLGVAKVDPQRLRALADSLDNSPAFHNLCAAVLMAGPEKMAASLTIAIALGVELARRVQAEMAKAA